MTDPDSPLDGLIAMVAAIEAAETRSDRLRALAANRLTGGDFDAVAIVMGDDPGAVEAVIDRLRAIEGMNDTATRMSMDLRKRAAVLAKAARAGLHEATPDDEASFSMDCGVEGLRVPNGYLIEEGGVFKLVSDRDGGTRAVRVAYAPMIVTRRLFSLDDMSHTLELSWMARGRWHRAIVPRAMAADGRMLVGMADRGAPVLGELARGLSTFLGAWEAVNVDALPRAYTSERLGWLDGGGFMLGGEVYGRDGARVVFDSDDGREQLVSAVDAGGTWEGWLAALDAIRAYPIAYAAIYASCAAPLLKIVGCDNFLVDFSARSGRGKSTALEAGASVWGSTFGDPKLIGSWSSTPTAIERRAALFCDLPMFLDETNAVSDAGRPGLAQSVYMIGNGVGKTRGTVTGMQRTSMWRTVALSTGEARLTEYTQDEGTRGRTISMVGAPLGKHGAERSEALKAAVRANYGHLGRRLMAWLVEADPAVVKAMYVAHLGEMAKHTAEASAMSRRLATYVALMAVAADIIHDEIGVPRPTVDPIAEVWRQAQATSMEADRAADALRTVWEVAVSRPTAFWGRHDGRQGKEREPNGGWLGGWVDIVGWGEIAFIGRALREMLEKAGHRPDAIINEWRGRGWLKINGKRNTSSELAGPGPRVRCYVITRAALVEIDAVDA